MELQRIEGRESRTNVKKKCIWPGVKEMKVAISQIFSTVSKSLFANVSEANGAVL